MDLSDIELSLYLEGCSESFTVYVSYKLGNSQKLTEDKKITIERRYFYDDSNEQYLVMHTGKYTDINDYKDKGKWSYLVWGKFYLSRFAIPTVTILHFGWCLPEDYTVQCILFKTGYDLRKSVSLASPATASVSLSHGVLKCSEHNVLSVFKKKTLRTLLETYPFTDYFEFRATSA